MNQSNIGVKGNEPLGSGWSFIFDLRAISITITSVLARCTPAKHRNVLKLLGEALAARETAGEPLPKPTNPKTNKRRERRKPHRPPSPANPPSRRPKYPPKIAQGSLRGLGKGIGLTSIFL
jgi:hypothetical protein